MKLPPVYTIYCLAVLGLFSYGKYHGWALSSAFAAQSRGTVSNGYYHHYTTFYHK
jgi:hypothetical protein